MISKLVGKLEHAAFRSALRKGGLRCPSCGAPPVAAVTAPDDWLNCAECGGKSAAREWVMSGGVPRGWADRPPADTAIRRETRDDGAIRWLIPPSGKSGGFLLFAVFWCAITAVVSGGFLIAILFGKPVEGADSVPAWMVAPFLLLFFGIFWAIGIGMFYVAARNKWARTGVMVSRDEVVLVRTLFGRKKEQRVPRASVESVGSEEFYRSNETPVYGITIKAGAKKLKFGSMLRDDEKGWLAADLKRVLCGEPERPVRTQQLTEEGPPIPADRAFSLLIPDAGRHLLPMAAVLTLMGLGFMAVGLFVIEGGTSIGRDGSAVARAFDLVFWLMSSGFRVIWTLISAAMTIAGVWMWIRLLRNRNSERRLEGDASVVAIRRKRHGMVLSEETFPRAGVTDLRTSSSGHSNGKPMNRIDLLADGKTRTLAWWVDADAAERFVAEARGSLWQ